MPLTVKAVLGDDTVDTVILCKSCIESQCTHPHVKWSRTYKITTPMPSFLLWCSPGSMWKLLLPCCPDHAPLYGHCFLSLRNILYVHFFRQYTPAHHVSSALPYMCIYLGNMPAHHISTPQLKYRYNHFNCISATCCLLDRKQTVGLLDCWNFWDFWDCWNCWDCWDCWDCWTDETIELLNEKTVWCLSVVPCLILRNAAGHFPESRFTG